MVLKSVPLYFQHSYTTESDPVARFNKVN